MKSRRTWETNVWSELTPTIPPAFSRKSLNFFGREFFSGSIVTSTAGTKPATAFAASGAGGRAFSSSFFTGFFASAM